MSFFKEHSGGFNRVFTKLRAFLCTVILVQTECSHTASYLHVLFFIRDLKTANVFLNKDNTIKVGDFGISKIMTTRAQAQTVLGTPYYISPEMVRD